MEYREEEEAPKEKEQKGKAAEKKFYFIIDLPIKKGQATKNHYYLIQIGHMVAQIIEGWKKIWEGIEQSREQKHRRMLENFKMVDLKEYKEEIQEQCQIRFE